MSKKITDPLALRLTIASKEYEVIRIKADQIALPENVTLMLERSKATADKLPDELPQKMKILKYLGAAEAALQRQDMRNVRFWFLKARMNHENALHDKWLMGVQRQFGKDADHRRQQVKEEREPEWQRWQAEADKIVAKSAIQLSKRALAIKVRNNLKLTDSVDTIRKRIK